MVVLTSGFPAVNPGTASAFYTVDDLLDGSPILVLYGLSTTTTSSSSASRIQAHIFTPAGLVSYPRLAISPSSPLYVAVHKLPKLEQGDEICRGLAFSLFKYFSELPTHVKDVWTSLAPQWATTPHVPELFSPAHAALLAPRLLRVANLAALTACAKSVFAEQSLTWLDVDVVFPPGSLRLVGPDPSQDGLAGPAAGQDDDNSLTTELRYGRYAPLVDLLGQPSFLPTSRLRRAPSKPGLNKHRVFSRKQKEALRREMCELLDTEESYVAKLEELVDQIANRFRDRARARTDQFPAAGDEAIEGLFPPSLDAILEANSAFLRQLRADVEETENEAIRDIGNTDDDDNTTYVPPQDKGKDITGAVRVANCLLRWLPKFAACYSDYIAGHGNFTGHLRTLIRHSPASFSRRLVETGEQRLMSMLIEPVQRLPRYSMFIDNITKQIPLRHPAMPLFLHARDAVSDICSQEEKPVAVAVIADELRKHASNVPADFPAHGRFITAVDVAMMLPRRNQADSHSLLSCPAVILLFTDMLVMIRKIVSSAIPASSLKAKLENAAGSEAAASVSPLPFEYIVAYSLEQIDVTEQEAGKRIQILRRVKPDPLSRSASRSSAVSSSSTMKPERILTKSDIISFTLLGHYEGRASRLMEEIAKARVEWRFSEPERESGEWEVRSGQFADLNVFTALCESGNQAHELGRAGPARVRMLVDCDRHPDLAGMCPMPEDFGVDVLVTVSVEGRDHLVLHIQSAGSDDSTTDNLRPTEVMAVLVKRLSNVLKMRSQLHTCQIPLILPLLIRNRELLKALPTTSDDDAVKQSDSGASYRHSVSRPTSPVKMLTSLFSSSVSRDSSKKNRHQFSRSVILNPTDIPKIPPPGPSKSQSRPSSKESPPVSLSSHPGRGSDKAEDSIADLENAFNSYVAALRARKGNVVGRAVQNRSVANELDVNELYNMLLEEPTNEQLAAQCSVDVLLAAFEKFIKFAWAERAGPVVNREDVGRIQSRFETAKQATDFTHGFREVFFGLPAHNQRAFQTMTSMLADLLDGTTNDSDRGILTAYFAEILIGPTGASPYDFISILDRFMDDFDLFFSPNRPLPAVHLSGRAAKSTSTSTTANSSLTSNTSIRKRLGFGLGSLSRENHKTDPTAASEGPSGLGSVWRSLSKTKTAASGLDGGLLQPTGRAGPPSFSRTVGPSKGSSFDLPRNIGTGMSVRSTGSDGRNGPRSAECVIPASTRMLPTRPAMNDRPSVLAAFSIDRRGGAVTPQPMSCRPFDSDDQSAGPQRRKKRRSSVSDMHTLRAEFDPEPGPRWEDKKSVDQVASPAGLNSRSPSKRLSGRASNIPVPTGLVGVISPTISRTGSPIRSGPAELSRRAPPPARIQLASPTRKENMAPLSAGIQLTSIPCWSTNSSPRKPAGQPLTMADQALSPTTPTVSSGVSRSGSVSGGSPQKLRMQSLTRLRERLHNERQALLDSEGSFHAEVEELTDALRALDVEETTAAEEAGSGLSKTFRIKQRRVLGGKVVAVPDKAAGPQLTTSHPVAQALEVKLAALDNRIRAATMPMQQALAALSRDFDSSLHVSEARARNLGKLYQEAVAENELGRCRFDDEIRRLTEAVAEAADHDGRVRLLELEDARRRDDLVEEVARLRRENSRLKQEVGGLRAQLRP